MSAAVGADLTPPLDAALEARPPVRVPLSPLGVLRHERDFRRLYLAELVSAGGDWFVLIPLLSLLHTLTGSGVWAGLVLACDTAFLAALSPWAGTVVDRVDRRRVLVASIGVGALVVLPLLAVDRPSRAWWALAVVGVLAAAKAFSGPAVNAALPNLVDPVDLPAANIANGAAWGIMLTLGGTLGGVLYEAAGETWCVAVAAVAYAGGGLLAASVRRPLRSVAAPTERRPVLDDLAETYRYARAHPRVGALMLVKNGVGMGNGVLALFPQLAVALGSAGASGLLFSGRGLGALVGPFLLRGRVTSPRRLTVAIAASMGLYGVSYGLAGWTGSVTLTVALVVVAHLGGGANWVLSSLALQQAVPDALRGRVFSVDLMVATLSVGVSQLVAGLVSDLVDVRVLVSCFGAVTASYGLLWFAVARRTTS